ncbi:MAG: hypothetical protein HND58_03525 [Planctomycetota bacterium]|nr:MAG: hypothetical protein HND58_03525 [Planctomycetota bacterium]
MGADDVAAFGAAGAGGDLDVGGDPRAVEVDDVGAVGQRHDVVELASGEEGVAEFGSLDADDLWGALALERGGTGLGIGGDDSDVLAGVGHEFGEVGDVRDDAAESGVERTQVVHDLEGDGGTPGCVSVARERMLSVMPPARSGGRVRRGGSAGE